MAMLHRREFLRATAAVALAPVSGALAQSVSSAADLSLARVFDAALDIILRRSPELATELGLDRGPRAGARALLDDRSLGVIKNNRSEDIETLRLMKGIDRNALASRSAIQFDTYLYILESQIAVNGRLGDISGSPYFVSQLDGAYQKIPSFLETKHPIETKADADAYVERLEAFAEILDQETERLRYDGLMGVVPPDFIVDLTLRLIGELAREPAARSTLVTSVAERAAAKSIGGNYARIAANIHERRILPALERQIATLQALRARVGSEAGIWKLRDGEALYNALLIQSTTTSMSAREVHEFGLDLTHRIAADTDAVLRAHGMTHGSVGARLRSLFEDRSFRFPNTDDSKGGFKFRRKHQSRFQHVPRWPLCPAGRRKPRRALRSCGACAAVS
jgi:uncharacterized protein (DUF885 family)